MAGRFQSLDPPCPPDLHRRPQSLLRRWSGVGVETLGYDGFFVLTFLLALPAFALLPWVRRWAANGDGRSVDEGVELAGEADAGDGAQRARHAPASASVP